jgi:hypothetical protein
VWFTDLTVLKRRSGKLMLEQQAKQHTDRKSAVGRIGVENRPYHDLTVRLVVISGFPNIYPDQTVLVQLQEQVSD